MSTYVDREFEAYRKDDAEARSILDSATEEGRDLTPEEDERFEKLFASAETHRKRADQLAAADQTAADLSEKVRAQIGDQHAEDPEPEKAPMTRSLVDAIKDHREAALRNVDRPDTVIEQGYNEDEIRAIADFSDASALYTSDFSTQVAVYARTASPWIALASVVNANNGRPLVIPALTADPTSYTPGEGTAITETTPTLGEGTATPVSYKALSYVSNEAEEDELIGLMGLIARAQGRSLGLAFGSAATTAILAAATNGGTATGIGGGATATFVGLNDLLTLAYGAAAPIRSVGVFVMSNGAIQKVRKFTDTVGQYLWQPAVRAGEPPTLDGFPVYEDPNLAAPASATKSIIFGDPKGWIIKQMPLRTAVSTEYRFNTDEVALRTVYRVGGALPDATALRYIVSADT